MDQDPRACFELQNCSCQIGRALQRRNRWKKDYDAANVKWIAEFARQIGPAPAACLERSMCTYSPSIPVFVAPEQAVLPVWCCSWQFLHFTIFFDSAWSLFAAFPYIFVLESNGQQEGNACG
jgi:hypothetical protein